MRFANRTWPHIRHIDPKGLSRLVRGDLDWIVMNSLEKDRTRRYDANSFAADIVRMSDEPVLEGPPTSRIGS